MIVLSVDASTLAHGIHYAVIGVGMLGLLYLLAPQLIGGVRDTATEDEHGRRVRAMHDQIAAGSLGTSVAVAARPVVARVRTASALLPLAVASSAAAAGVHAGVGPAHFREQVLFGLFFAGSALAQILWSMAMVLKPSRALLQAAVVGNSAVLLLWLTTRTVGLPGLLPVPEGVGPWDLTCAVWEAVVVVASFRFLQSGEADVRLPLWDRWPFSARAWALGSALVLGLLAMSGAGA